MDPAEKRHCRKVVVVGNVVHLEPPDRSRFVIIPFPRRNAVLSRMRGSVTTRSALWSRRPSALTPDAHPQTTYTSTTATRPSLPRAWKLFSAPPPSFCLPSTTRQRKLNSPCIPKNPNPRWLKPANPFPSSGGRQGETHPVSPCTLFRAFCRGRSLPCTPPRLGRLRLGKYITTCRHLAITSTLLYDMYT